MPGKINTNPASFRFSLPFHGLGAPTQALRQGSIRGMTESEWLALNPNLQPPRTISEMVNPGKQAPPHGMRAVQVKFEPNPMVRDGKGKLQPRTY